MFTAMRELLALGYQTFTAADVLRIATLGGARALGLTDVGSLAVGNQADLVLLRGTDLNLVAHLGDPIATVVTSAHPGNVDTVFVGGTAVKRDGELVSSSLPACSGRTGGVGCPPQRFSSARTAVVISAGDSSAMK